MITYILIILVLHLNIIPKKEFGSFISAIFLELGLKLVGNLQSISKMFAIMNNILQNSDPPFYSNCLGSSATISKLS